jgi:transcriptional antiterminator RfaH
MTWYVARTRSGKEHYAAAILRQRTAEVYLPTIRRRTPRAGRRDWEPFFPGYLFAELEVPSQQWLAVRSAPDVLHFVGNASHPTPLPPEFIGELKARVARLNGEGGLPRFQAGDRVRITDGPFRYMEALFDGSLSPSGRARVLLQILSRLVPVEMPGEYLEKIAR